RCAVATNALELGIDIGALDAVVCAGYPGSIAALWQRFGRAGRRGDPSLALLVCSSGALDQYFAAAPELLVGSPVEQARIDRDNVVVIELGSDRVLAEMDFRSAHTMLHEQAIYQHDAEQYQVERLDLPNRKGFVRKVAPDYFTTAMTNVKVTVIEEERRSDVFD